MATIVLNDTAPNEAIHFSLANAEFDLGGKSDSKSYETTDRAVIDNAVSHPWLDVQVPEVEEASIEALDTRVPPTEDAQSSLGPNANDAFDPEKIKAAEEAKRADQPQPLAIDAGLDQTEAIVTDSGAAETLAADEAHTAAKSAKNFQTTTESDN